MIREFDKEDLIHFEPNDYSSPDDIKYVFEDEAWWLYTLENKGIKAIMAFRETENNEWAIFALISKHFTARDSVEMKAFIHRAEAALKPSKVWTFSLPIAATDKWHKFLGFVFEKPFEFMGRNYNMWAKYETV